MSSILLQTADIVLENPNNKKQVKTKVLFDQGSQRSYVTKRIKNVLGLTAIANFNTYHYYFNYFNFYSYE